MTATEKIGKVVADRKTYYVHFNEQGDVTGVYLGGDYVKVTTPNFLSRRSIEKARANAK